MTAKCCQAFPEITRGLKTLAQELDMPVLSPSQLSRLVEQRTDGQAQLSDNPARGRSEAA
jgi:replicative DNA helicase